MKFQNILQMGRITFIGQNGTKKTKTNKKFLMIRNIVKKYNKQSKWNKNLKNMENMSDKILNHK